MARIALLIGVSEYGPGLNWLPGAVKDVEAMQHVLQHPSMGDFAEVETLKNPAPLAMRVAIENLFKHKVRDRDDLVLLFFSGHCINDRHNQLYFATRLTCKNSQGELIETTAVPASFVKSIMNDSCSRQQVAILDCCFSNAFADARSDRNHGTVDVKNQLGGTRRAVLTGSGSTQQFLLDKGFELSDYTRYLVEGITTGAADFNQDRCISVYELHQYITRKVEETAAKLQPTIYVVGDSYNIQIAQAPAKNLQPEFAVAARQIVPPTITGHSSLQTVATQQNRSLDLTSSSTQLLTPRSPYSLLGTGITVLVLAGIMYGIARWQDLQHLPMSGTIAADSSYKYQVPKVFEHANTVWSLAFSPDSQLLASSSGDKTIKLWHLPDGELLRTFSGAHSDTIWSVAFSTDGQTLVSGSGDKTVKIWSLKDGQLLRTLKGHTDTVRSVAISSNRQIIVSGSGDKSVKVWNFNTGELLRTLVGHTDTVRSVAISPDGKTLASGGADNTVKIWNGDTGKLLHNLTGHTGRIISIAISPDGKIVASGSNDNTIRLWDLDTGALLRSLTGHTDHINSIAFRSDSKVLVSGAEDHLIKTWNPQTGALLHTLTKHAEDVYAVAISPDGKTLASGDKDGEIKLGQ